MTARSSSLGKGIGAVTALVTSGYLAPLRTASEEGACRCPHRGGSRLDVPPMSTCDRRAQRVVRRGNRRRGRAQTLVPAQAGVNYGTNEVWATGGELWTRSPKFAVVAAG